MPLRIIDNKRIELTESEFQLYQELVKGYEGDQYFKDLFETDKDGLIIFLRPPNKFSSLECFLYLACVMQHQHLRKACNEVYSVLAEAREEIKALKEERKKIQSRRGG